MNHSIFEAPKAHKESSLDTPGPGSYDFLESSFVGRRQFTISRAYRFAEDAESFLGPGLYSPRTSHKVRGAALGKSTRPEIQAQQGKIMSPGPGRYESNIKPSGPSYSMTTREQFAVSQSPGPGEYELPMPNARHTCKFGSERTTEYTFGPGPCVYTPVLPSTTIGTKFAKSPREKTDKSKCPGPGSYNIPTVKHRRACSFGGRYTTDNAEIYAPGPGAYDWEFVDTSFTTGMSKSPRFPPEKAKAPGPGTYNYHEPHYLRVIQINKPFKKAKEIIGFVKKGASIKGRYKEKLCENSPGSKYYVENSIGKAGAKFTQGPRLPMTCQDNPGPGSYSVSDKMVKGCKIGSEARIPLSFDFVPGPGKYNCSGKIGKSANFSINSSKAYNYL